MQQKSTGEAVRFLQCFYILPLQHFNFEMLRWLREQTPAVEA